MRIGGLSSRASRGATYSGAAQPFLVGRGAVDDKGPAVLGFIMMRALANLYDGTNALDGLTIEQIFDTSEETDFSTAYYFQEVGVPDFGIVFDAVWTVRAEKGIERPIFTVPLGAAPSNGIFIEAFNSAPGGTNQIPDTVTARINGDDEAALDSLAANVANLYQQYGFDDPQYRRAPLEVSRDAKAVVLTTKVIGAQHGSVPDQNRARGGQSGHLAGELPRSPGGQRDARAERRRADGAVHGLGLGHDCLRRETSRPARTPRSGLRARQRDDLRADARQTSPQDVTLRIDIRYALGHHGVAWDGKTEGQLPGTSIFPDVFENW